ncbi:hypothetical protein ACOMHN_013078 [Nucella lapillus]
MGAKQEKRLNAFRLRCFHHTLGTTRKTKVPSIDLSCPGLPAMFSLLRQRRLRWLGHVNRTECRIPKDHLYGELTSGKKHWLAREV